MSPLDDATRDALLAEAAEHHAAGRLEACVGVLRPLLASGPPPPEALHLLGLVALQAGDATSGERLLAQASAGCPESALIHLNLGLVRASQGRLAEALPCFRQAVALAPDSGIPLHNLAVCLQQLGREAEAVPCLQRLADLGVAEPDLLGSLGRWLLQAGRWEEAARAFDQLEARLPGDAEALRLGGLARLEAGRREEAADRILAALARQEDAASRTAFLHLARRGWGATPAPRLAPWLVRALEAPWCRPADLWAPALEVLDRLAPPTAEDEDLGHLAGLPLLETLLGALPMASLPWEARLTRARVRLLQAAEGHLSPEVLSLACALARQAFLNEYLWVLEPEAAARGEALTLRLEAHLAEGTAIPEALVAAVASLRPLHTLAGATGLLARTWPEPLQALLAQQLREPAEEARIRAALPTLTPLGPGVSADVRAQYEANPYPRWTRTALPVPAPTFEACLAQQGIRALGPVAAQGGARILVAGCGTGREALEAARSCEGAEVLAVDLSRTSLAYGARMAEEAGLRNLRFAQADLLELGGLADRFVVIVAFGVLHHLADPLAGWRVLRNLLAPGGVMWIGLYSERGRAEVVTARELIARQGLPPTPEGIRRMRALLQTPSWSARVPGLLGSHDFFSLSTCRDLLFHVQEHRLTLPRLKAWLDDLGLAFLGFQLPPEVRAAYASRFPQDPAGRDLEGWDAFEAEHPTLFSGMYQLWVQRP